MRVEDLLRESAAERSEKLALVDGPTRMTYGDLDADSDRLAAGLVALGVERGNRVVILMDNIAEAALSIFAVLKAGAVFCPVNPSLKGDGLGQLLADCRPRAVLTQAKYAPGCAAAAGALAEPPLIVVARAQGPLVAGLVPFETLVGSAVSRPTHIGAEADLAMIIYTSGSTGQAKGVMMQHSAMLAVSASIASYLGNSLDDVVLGALPLSFTYGLYQLMVSVRTGGTLVLAKGFAFPHAVLEEARKEGVTGLPLVPTMAAMLLSMNDLSAASLPALRYITNAAAPLPAAHIAGLRRLFPGVRLYSMYGLSECARATSLPPEEIDRKPESVGKAIPGTEVAIVDGEGLPVARGDTGELVVRGPHLMLGYWENEAATRETLRPDPATGETQLHTGDLFRADTEGFLHFVGRKDDIIKIRGEKVAPRRVEAVLHACPGVREAVVTGVPDALLGNVLHATVVASDPQLSARAVMRHCARHLPDFMVPKAVAFRDALPKTASGKVLRRLVKATGTAA